MTPEQIATWAASNESETLEFKSTTGGRREAMRTLCGMLNHRGGRILFGVESNGRVTGQQISDRTIEEVAEEVGNIDPPIFPTIDQVDVGNGRAVLVVSVATGQNGPYSYRGQAYRRVGNTSPELSRDEYHRMLLERMHGERRWENESADGWCVTDLDEVQIVQTLDEAIRRGRTSDPGTRDPTEVLRGFGLLREGVLLRAAPVLFGRAERVEAELPQCLLRVARFHGNDRTEFLDNRQFHGNLLDLLMRAERFLRDSLPVAGRILPGLFERVDDPLYPPIALREALANAFCHRDYGIGGGSVAVAIYDDRLEITSSGSLHFGLTAEALLAPHESLPWNPLIARVLYRRGVIESWGRGTTKMAELAKKAGLPVPDIEDAAGCVTVRFRPTHFVAPQLMPQELTERQSKILALLATGAAGLALRDVCAALDGQAEEATVKQDVELLLKLGLIEKHGRGNYLRPAKGRPARRRVGWGKATKL